MNEKVEKIWKKEYQDKIGQWRSQKRKEIAQDTRNSKSGSGDATE